MRCYDYYINILMYVQSILYYTSIQTNFFNYYFKREEGINIFIKVFTIEKITVFFLEKLQNINIYKTGSARYTVFIFF